MNRQFIPQSEVDIWKTREDLLSKIRQNATQLFGGEWSEDSVWELSKYLILQLQKYGQDGDTGDKHKSFFYAMAGQLDFDLLISINKYLDRLLEVVPVPAVEVVRSQLPATLVEEWKVLGDYLDLTPAGGEKIWERVKGLPELELTRILEGMRPMANSYNDFRVIFMFVASALIYRIPANPVIDLDSFKYVLSVEAEKNPGSFDIENGLVVVNFLGWSLTNKDVETMRWVVEYLTKQFEMDNAIFGSNADTLLLAVFLHLGFFNLADQPREVQEELTKKFIWSALCFGVPVENILRETLLKDAVSKNQKGYADNLAEILVVSAENIYLTSSKPSITVGEFIKRFLAISRGDHGGFVQVKYVGDLLKEYGWPEGLRYYLFALLNLYFHLKTGEILSVKRTDELKIKG